jgi:membrane-associated phospholipid phosphatase
LKQLSGQVQRRPVTVSAALLSLLAALRVWLQWFGPLPGDRYAVTHFGSSHPEGYVLRHFTSFFSSFGTPLVAAAVVCMALLVLGLRTDRRVACGFVAACLVIPLNALLKLISGPTPLWIATDHHGVNFPSGHVAFVTSVVGYLGWVAARRHQPAAVVVALLVIVGMGPARVVAGAHLVSDVVAGYLVGGAVLVLAVALSDRSAVSKHAAQHFEAAGRT